MLTHHDIREAARIKLETLREEATQHRDTGCKPFFLRRALFFLGGRATRGTLKEGPAPVPPSPSTNRLQASVD